MAAIKNSQKIKPCLWFDNNAEEAVKFYTSVFKKSKIKTVSHYGKNAPMPEGTVLTVDFELDGEEFLALNGGPIYKFTEAISFVVYCKTQKEIDHYWEKLSKGGEKIQCGWLKDKYGLTWQVVPTILETMMADKNKEKSSRMMNALMKMKKLDIKKLKEAYAGK